MASSWRRRSGQHTVQQNVEASTNGIALSALGILPLSYRWEVYARGGFLISNSTENIFISDGVGSQRLRASNAAASILLAGRRHQLQRGRDLSTCGWSTDRVFDVGYDKSPTRLEEADVDMLTLNIAVSF